MFDIGWSEVLVIAAVAIIVVGPKELPKMLRTFGKTMGTVRRTANDFKRQFDQALREAEREADLDDTRKQLQSLTKLDDPAQPKKPAAAVTPEAAGAGAISASTAEPAAGEPAARPQAGANAA